MILVSEEVGSVLMGLSFQNIPAKRSEHCFYRSYEKRVLVLLLVLSKLIPIFPLTGPTFLFKKICTFYDITLSLSQKLYPKGMGECFLANAQHNIVDVLTKQIVN